MMVSGPNEKGTAWGLPACLNSAKQMHNGSTCSAKRGTDLAPRISSMAFLKPGRSQANVQAFVGLYSVVEWIDASRIKDDPQPDLVDGKEFKCPETTLPARFSM
jgi:hypothetical protein